MISKEIMHVYNIIQFISKTSTEFFCCENDIYKRKIYVKTPYVKTYEICVWDMYVTVKHKMVIVAIRKKHKH